MNTKQTLHILQEKIQFTPMHNEQLAIVGPVKLPVVQRELEATFQWYSWMRTPKHFTAEDVIDALPAMELAQQQQSSVLVYGDFEAASNPLVRFHSICHTGDIFGSQRCDCGFQLHESMKMIVEHGAGAIFYIANHEGRGIGLFSKSLAYVLQQEGFDTVEANEELGFDDDTRDYSEALTVLQALRQQPVTLITNNPKKLAALQAAGLSAHGHVPLWGGVTETNRFYLETKIAKSGHARDGSWMV